MLRRSASAGSGRTRVIRCSGYVVDRAEARPRRRDVDLVPGGVVEPPDGPALDLAGRHTPGRYMDAVADVVHVPTGAAKRGATDTPVHPPPVRVGRHRTGGAGTRPGPPDCAGRGRRERRGCGDSDHAERHTHGERRLAEPAPRAAPLLAWMRFRALDFSVHGTPFLRLRPVRPVAN